MNMSAYCMHPYFSQMSLSFFSWALWHSSAILVSFSTSWGETKSESRNGTHRTKPKKNLFSSIYFSYYITKATFVVLLIIITQHLSRAAPSPLSSDEFLTPELCSLCRGAGAEHIHFFHATQESMSTDIKTVIGIFYRGMTQQLSCCS